MDAQEVFHHADALLIENSTGSMLATMYEKAGLDKAAKSTS
jgi:hypothetical protein